MNWKPSPRVGHEGSLCTNKLRNNGSHVFCLACNPRCSCIALRHPEFGLFQIHLRGFTDFTYKLEINFKVNADGATQLAQVEPPIATIRPSLWAGMIRRAFDASHRTEQATKGEKRPSLLGSLCWDWSRSNWRWARPCAETPSPDRRSSIRPSEECRLNWTCNGSSTSPRCALYKWTGRWLAQDNFLKTRAPNKFQFSKI